MTSKDRILTTHTGSLPRAGALTGDGSAGLDPEQSRAVAANIVAKQIATGLDVVNDGEMSKPSYVGYVTSRLTGFSGPPAVRRRRDVEEFPSTPGGSSVIPRSRRCWRHPRATG